MLRALFRNTAAGQVVEGASTITQQLIKISYLESDRTYERKIQEFVIALWLENKFGKDEILTRYLNNIYLGAGATGMANQSSVMCAPAHARIGRSAPRTAHTKASEFGTSRRRDGLSIGQGANHA